MTETADLAERVAALETRLGLLGGPGLTPLAAAPPITVGELVDVPAPGSPIASQWAQEISNRVVQRFATKAALDAWAAANGSVGVTADNGVWLRAAGVWQLIGGDRVGFAAINAGQSWLAGQTFSMSWPTESYDTDGFGAGGAPLTIPAGLDGIYVMAAYIGAAGAIVAGSPTSVSLVVAGAIVANALIPIAQTSVSVSFVNAMSAGQNMQVQIVNGHNASMQYSGQVRLHRISP